MTLPVHFADTIESCNRCDRLRTHCQKIAHDKRKQFASDTYWGKPVSGFGDANPKVWIIGLAPAAHGANRTGRIFTGDQSGVWLYRALYRAGLANQEASHHRQDGLKLKDTYVSCAVRCAPPDNKPTPAEFESCLPYLAQEYSSFSNLKVVLCLGALALKQFQKIEKSAEKIKFSHGASQVLSRQVMLVSSYHPSQQNTFTKRLTEPMFDKIFEIATKFIA